MLCKQLVKSQFNRSFNGSPLGKQVSTPNKSLRSFATETSKTLMERLVKVSIKKGKRTIADKRYNQAKVQRRTLGYKNPTREREKCIDVLSPRVTIRSEVRSGQSIQVPAARSRELQYGKSVRILRESALTEAASLTSGSSTNKIRETKETTAIHNRVVNRRLPKLNIEKSYGFVRANSKFSYNKGIANRMANTVVKVLESNPGSSAVDKRNTLHRTAISQLSALR